MAFMNRLSYHRVEVQRSHSASCQAVDERSQRQRLCTLEIILDIKYDICGIFSLRWKVPARFYNVVSEARDTWSK
jgi:hypothetical protein